MSISEISGSIVETHVEGRAVRFFVVNAKDEIQKHHAAGVFYETEQLAAMAKFVDPRRVFLDVGANVGNHTLYAALVMGVGKIIPFEVNPAAMAILDINLALNRCTSVDTSFLGVGAGSSDCHLDIAASWPDNLGGTRFARIPNGQFSAIRLDGIVAHLPIGFIKVDVEGMEMDVLAGLRETVGRWHPMLFLEIEDEQMPEFDAWNKPLGYRVEATFIRYRGKKEYLLSPPTGRRESQ